MGGKCITTCPTAEYPLELEYYENLYCQFASLIAGNICAVDDVTPQLLQEIQAGAKLTKGLAYYT